MIGRSLRFMVGLWLGVVFGAGLVLLLAPQSGADTRQAVRERIQGIMDEGRVAAEVRRLELTTQFEALKGTQSGETV
jgi:gas vesicle protein